MPKKRNTNKVTINPDDKSVVVVFGTGVLFDGTPYTYFEKDRDLDDALESLQYEINDNIVSPILFDPDATFEIKKYDHTTWSVETKIPKDKELGIEEDMTGFVAYWTTMHWYSSELDEPAYVSLLAVDEEHYNDKVLDKLEEIFVNKDFDFRIVNPADDKSCFLILYCDTYENVGHLNSFLKEYMDMSEEQIKELMPDYYQWLEEKTTTAEDTSANS